MNTTFFFLLLLHKFIRHLLCATRGDRLAALAVTLGFSLEEVEGMGSKQASSKETKTRGAVTPSEGWMVRGAFPRVGRVGQARWPARVRARKTPRRGGTGQVQVCRQLRAKEHWGPLGSCRGSRPRLGRVAFQVVGRHRGLEQQNNRRVFTSMLTGHHGVADQAGPSMRGAGRRRGGTGLSLVQLPKSYLLSTQPVGAALLRCYCS